MLHSLAQLFPRADRVSKKTQADLFYYLPLEKEQWLAIPKEGLTDRESFLLSHLLDQTQDFEKAHSSPWYNYLVTQSQDLPVTIDRVQFLHCRVQHRNAQESKTSWLEMMASIFPNLVSHFALSDQDMILIMSQSPSLSLKDILDQVLPSLEFDFEMKLTVLIGQIWPQRIAHLWPSLFQLEQGLFQETIKHSAQPSQLGFSTLLLRGQMTCMEKASPLFHQLKDLIEHEEMEAIVKALWREQAVLTKTAQALYLHRNTLQYRLDRFYEQTGLWLRHMDDLAACYLALLT